ncbi:MAG TPA: pseudouridine-5'-phosphate glycosidase [Thermoflexia bacterium]|nr:pseudouridine-5'-phosphate glycosidase [Thermoflexia bacterium]
MKQLQVNPQISTALAEGRPLVALESALITHGFAYPASVEITAQMAAAIRAEGAEPAVVGIWHGAPTVGLSDAQIKALAADKTAVKVSVRDLPLAGVRGLHGGTTVATTALLAHRAGLRVFATGGIGGVHRGHPEDISADLPVLASTPIIVVCAGAKAILDLPRTLEFLETWGVPVLGWQAEEFAAFYSRSAGLPVDQKVADAETVAAIYHQQRALQLPQGILLTAPIPAAAEVPPAESEPLIAQALAEAEAQAITGKRVTPYLLARLVELSGKHTQIANESLLINNARVAAQVACALATK